MYADTINLWKVLDQQIELYKLNHNKTPSSKAIACLVSKVLYGKRFFPYYVFNIVVGYDNGKPTIWNYDAIGTLCISKCRSNGNGKFYLTPFLDDNFLRYHQKNKKDLDL